MVTITNPRGLLITGCIICGWMVIKRWFNTTYYKWIIPKRFINRSKAYLYHGIQLIMIGSFSLLPIELSYQYQGANINIILDTSPSMEEQDIHPTRLTIAEGIITQLNQKSGIHTNHCISQKSNNVLNQECIIIHTLPLSGSALGDMLLILSDIINHDSLIVVLSDGGINQGITLEQSILSGYNSKHIAWIDIFPLHQSSTATISGQRGYYDTIDSSSHHEYDLINRIHKQTKTIALRPWIIGIFLISGIVWLFMNFSSGAFLGPNQKS
ncbi:MAG TPA: hypothetical protein PK048_02920 [Candidatus Absconditabacterales bacterium]|nr:hypothetical protein [Candidatus Absconditabacterales bacterium]